VTVHALPVATEPWLKKKQIAEHYGRSTRWVERQMHEGMPHRKSSPAAWPMFRLSECDAWLSRQSEDD
jgi:hypothetical protein